MNIKALATGALLLLAVGGAVYVLVGEQSEGTAADTLPADGVVVYYFHGTKRCGTCNKMERLTAEVVNDRFGERRRDGSVAFRAVNLETDATRHFITDFELASKAVVMVERGGGKDLAWRRLDAIWEKIADDAAYSDYIAENLTACLANLDES